MSDECDESRIKTLHIEHVKYKLLANLQRELLQRKFRANRNVRQFNDVGVELNFHE